MTSPRAPLRSRYYEEFSAWRRRNGPRTGRVVCRCGGAACDPGEISPASGRHHQVDARTHDIAHMAPDTRVGERKADAAVCHLGEAAALLVVHDTHVANGTLTQQFRFTATTATITGARSSFVDNRGWKYFAAGSLLASV